MSRTVVLTKGMAPGAKPRTLCSSGASLWLGRGRSRSSRNGEVIYRHFRQWLDSSRVDAPSHPGDDGYLAGALESKCERKCLSLHQARSQPKQCEVICSRLERDRRFGWYGNSFRSRRGYASAVHEEGAADGHGFGDPCAATEQAVVHAAIVPNRERDGHLVPRLPGPWIGSRSRTQVGEGFGAGRIQYVVRSGGRNACHNQQADGDDHGRKWDAADWLISLARSWPHAASMSSPREYRTDVAIPAVRKMPAKRSIPAGSGRS